MGIYYIEGEIKCYSSLKNVLKLVKYILVFVGLVILCDKSKFIEI